VQALSTQPRTSPRRRLLKAAKEVYGRDLFAPRHELLSAAKVGKATIRKYFANLEELRECAFTSCPMVLKHSTDTSKLDLTTFLPNALRGMKLHVFPDRSRLRLWQQYHGGSVFGITIARSIETELFVAGVCLFSGEGTKSLLARKVELVNSDPVVIRIFLRFLKAIGVPAKEVVFRIQTDKRRMTSAKRYWKNVLGIPRSQFRSPIIKKRDGRDGRTSLVVMYSNTLLQLLLNYWATQLDRLV
jgi:hypothetical protein